MMFAARLVVSALRRRRDIIVWHVEDIPCGGAIVHVLDVSRPVAPGTPLVELRVTAEGRIESDAPEFARLAS